jgi:HTH-type transcriptional regulator/antitoxin HipB
MSLIADIGVTMLIRTPKDLGAAIRDRRRQMGLDQATLAKHIGVRAELGLVLRALEAVGIRLDTDTGVPDKPRKSARTPTIDIDAIVRSARKDKP